jgi:hypothetical protein
MERKLTIIINHVEGTVDYESDEGITVFEALGAIEYVKLLISKEIEDAE